MAVVIECTFTNLLTSRYNILHLHWPDSPLSKRRLHEALLGSFAMLAAVIVARIRRAKVVWTAHNIQPHETRHHRLMRWLRTRILRRISGIISLSESARCLLNQRMPPLSRLPSRVTPHGHYRDAYPNTLAKAACRQRLGLEAGHQVILFIGQIRAYKNTLGLIRAFKELPGGHQRLVIAGRVVEDPALEVGLRQEAAGDPRILLSLAPVPTDDLQIHLNAADLVVTPFTHITNSGSVILALSFDRPVLVPITGSMVDLMAQVGEPWIIPLEGPINGAKLGHAMERAQTLSHAHCQGLDAYDWAGIAMSTAEFLTLVASGQGHQPPRDDLAG